MSFATGLAIFFAFCALFLLVIARAFHAREEEEWRKLFTILAVATAAAAFGSWAGGHWHS